MEIGAEISHKIRHAIKAKLVDLGAYVDDELPDYIMVMVANKKTQQQMTDDLALFLGNNAAKFTTWLHEVLYKLQSVTVETLKSEKKKDKLRPEGARDARDHEPRSSTHVEHVSSKRKAEQSERVDSSKTISKKHKRADWDESANASSSKLTESSVSQTAHQTKSPDAHPSTCDQQENADADDSESLDSRPGLPNEIGEGSQSREQAASSKEDSEEEQEKGDATSENENSAEEVEVEPEKEEMLLDVKPGEGEQIDSDSEAEQDYQPIKKKIVHGCVISTKQKVLQKVVPSKTSSGVHKPGASTAPSVGATVERTERVVEVTRSDSRREMETRRNLSSTRGDLRRPASAVQHSETAIGKSAEGAVPKKRQVPGSVIAGVIKREEVVEEAYNPYKPSVGAVASTVKVTPRRFLPKSLQANKSLLLKAMTDAESSIAKAVKLPGHTTMAVDQKHSSVHDRLGGAATKRQHPAQRAGKSAALSERMVSKQQQQLPAQKRRDDRQKSGVKKTLARPTVLQRLGLPMEKSSSTQTARGFERRASNHVAEVITIKQEVEEPEVFILSEDDDAEQESQGDARKAGEDEEEAVETEEAGREKMKPLLERSPSSGPSEESKDVTSGDELVNEEDIQDVSVGEELDRRLIQIDKDEVNVKKERRGDGDGFSLDSTEEGEIPHRIVEAKGREKASPNFIVTLDGVNSDFANKVYGKKKGQPRATVTATVQPMVTKISLKRSWQPEPQSGPTRVQQAYPTELQASSQYRQYGAPLPAYLPSSTSSWQSAATAWQQYTPHYGLPNEGIHYSEQQPSQQIVFADTEPQTVLTGETAVSPSSKVCAPQHEAISFTINDDSEEDEEQQIRKPSKQAKPAERCKFWPACKQGDQCRYHHPTIQCRTFPNCTFGDRCLYIHPNCVYDSKCTKLNCPYTHASKRSLAPMKKMSSRPMVILSATKPTARTAKLQKSQPVVCKFHPKCTNMNCPYLHPGPCRYSSNCVRQDCRYSHPTVAEKSSLKWTAH